MIKRQRAIVSFCPTLDVESFLSLIPDGQRSRWINECLEQHIGDTNMRIDLDMWEALVNEIEDLNSVVESLTHYDPVYEIWDNKLGEMVPCEPAPPPDFGPGDGEPYLERGDTVYILYKRQFARRQFVDTPEELEACDWVPDRFGNMWHYLDENRGKY